MPKASGGETLSLVLAYSGCCMQQSHKVFSGATMGVNLIWLDIRQALQKGIHVWYCKSCPKVLSWEGIDARKEHLLFCWMDMFSHWLVNSVYPLISDVSFCHEQRWMQKFVTSQRTNEPSSAQPWKGHQSHSQPPRLRETAQRRRQEEFKNWMWRSILKSCFLDMT